MRRSLARLGETVGQVLDEIGLSEGQLAQMSTCIGITCREIVRRPATDFAPRLIPCGAHTGTTSDGGRKTLPAHTARHSLTADDIPQDHKWHQIASIRREMGETVNAQQPVYNRL